MGLFNRLGREVEEFRRTARDAAEESEALVCRTCEARLAATYEECPRCGGDDLVRADAASADAAASGAMDAEDATGAADAGDASSAADEESADAAE